MRNRLLLLPIVGIGLLLAGSTAWAVTPSYAPDYRGDPNSVHAIFDLVVEVTGDIGTGVVVDTHWNTSLFETGPSSYPLDMVSAEAADVGDNVVVSLPNFIDPLEHKLVRIQMFFAGPDPVPADQVGVDVLAFDSLPTSWEVVGGSGPGDALVHYVDIEIQPNPDWEQITLVGGAIRQFVILGEPGNYTVGLFSGLRSIEIDTVSVPEPATLGMLLIGGMALLRCRHKGFYHLLITRES